MVPHSPFLLQFLSTNPSYYGRFNELRQQVEAWLEYIPATFPHYTRHTLGHSDEIIIRMSKILSDDRTGRPTISISETEAYILVCSALLHDVGMVTSDLEKVQILESEDWQQWVSQDPQAGRMQEIAALRDEGHGHSDIRNYLADMQLRFLLAEYIRRHHHTRSIDLLRQHPTTMGDYAFKDPILQRTIEAVCAGHGLAPNALKDDVRFPHRRDIRSDRVNVRFAAIMLRLGDLLDMRSDRACPLLLSAASPLPSDSMAHWTQYQRIVHEVIAPDKIELRAECDTHDEHRVLHDWLSWIEIELRHAQELMARAPRHGDWSPPRASMGGDDPTLVVVPSDTATYRPVDWTFQLDKRLVIDRLTDDLYANRLGFIRELVQNSADASRCRMYVELERSGAPLPSRCDLAPAGALDAHAIRISFRWEDRPHTLSGSTRRTQVVVIEDSGIGMDAEVIHDYFLQIGRSFYRSPSFRRQYPFQPTSRFGIGFLSVFAVSDYIEVDTFNPDSPRKDGPLKLTLTGPSNFILLEKGTRATPGTTINVYMREGVDVEEVLRFLGHNFVFLEFPLEIYDERGERTTITAERGRQFEVGEDTETDGQTQPFAVRAFQVDHADYYGTLYVFAHVDGVAERWDRHYWATHDYREENPAAEIPRVPDSVLAFHGVALDGFSRMHRSSGQAARIDYRGAAINVDLARQQTRRSHLGPAILDPARAEWPAVLDEHLAATSAATGPDGWLYRNRLMQEFELAEYWRTVEGTVRLWNGTHFSYTSLTDLCERPVIEVTLRPAREYQNAPWPWRDKYLPSPIDQPESVLSADLKFWGEIALSAAFGGRLPTSVNQIVGDHWTVNWTAKPPDHNHPFPGYEGRNLVPVPFTNSELAGVPGHSNGSRFTAVVFLNSLHPFIEWLIRFCRWGEVDSARIEPIAKMLAEIIRYRHVGVTLRRLNTYVNGLSRSLHISEDLQAPPLLTESDVRFPWGAD